MKTEKDYDQLAKELQAIEARYAYPHPLNYLHDICVDAENAEVPSTHPEYWNRMYESACFAAGSRAEEYGESINDLIGRTIY